MKADRDANFVEQNDKGVTVNRWNTTGLLVSSASANESGYLTVKMARVAGDGRARYPGTNMTRADGVQSGPDVRQRCDDQPLGGHQEH